MYCQRGARGDADSRGELGSIGQRPRRNGMGSFFSHGGRGTAWLGAALVLACLAAAAQEPNPDECATDAEPGEGFRAVPLERAELRLAYANDAIIDNTGREDWGYTSGIRLEAFWPVQLGSAPARGGVARPRPLDERLRPFLETADGQARPRVGIAAGQDIFTPRVFGGRRVLPGDRPYAGWLYLGALAELKTRLGLLDAELDVGVTGSSSYAGSAQNYVHSTIGSPVLGGWKNQIAEGVGVELTLTGGYYLADAPAPWAPDSNLRVFDLLFYGQSALGNVLLAESAGATARLGRIVRPEGSSIRPPAPARGTRAAAAPLRPGDTDLFQLYAYGRVQAQWVVHNTLIEGWPGRDIPHAAGIAPLVYEAEGGVVFQPINLVEVTASATHRSRETRLGRSDRHGHTFGQIELGLHFF